MIIVTGGAGFIGSNCIHALNHELSQKNILLVDELLDANKCSNIADLDIADYWDKHDFLDHIKNNFAFPENIKAIFHQGACSDTTETNGQYLMKNNYEYSKILLHYCLEHKIPFIYASSASVYGAGPLFVETRNAEKPLNMYAYSKWQFDQYVRRLLPHAKSQIVGLRYFNVYGNREQHKGKMASVAFHLYQQLKNQNVVKLFEGSDGFGNGEQRRDFVYVKDVVDVNLWFLSRPQLSGIYNVGTGRAQSFNEVANAVITSRQKGEIEYIPFPDQLKGRYQSFTEADITALRAAGYHAPFKTVQEGVSDYMKQLSQ